MHLIAVNIFQISRDENLELTLFTEILMELINKNLISNLTLIYFIEG